MITIIENRFFIEGIFNTLIEAENYLSEHPKKENCRLIETLFSTFPFYIIEINDKFTYTNENEVIKYINGIDFDKIENNEELILNLYRISEPYKSKKYNSDNMGILEHTHFTKGDIIELKESNNWEEYLYK